jgi:glutamate carboxypeptidase
MHRYLSYLKWIENEYETMIALVEKWANINSHSENLAGLAEMTSTLQKDFQILEGEMTIHNLPSRIILGPEGNRVEVPLGQALSIRKRPTAPIQVLLGGHMDTVFPISSPFQHSERLDANTLRGPGVTDLKGGLAIMLKALEALERSPYTSQIGWEILINPDEEIGSPGSYHLFEKAARRHQAGLIFEPAFADGAFVSARKGSATYSVIAHGRAAHAGRDFSTGRSSIYAIAHVIRELEDLNQNDEGLTINIGHIRGGGPVNIVPDLAICHLNMRALTTETMLLAKEKVDQIIEKCSKRDGIKIEIFEEYSKFPKPFDGNTQALFEQYQSCAEKLRIPFHLRESGGVCDGNTLAANGLPTIDSAGAVGGGMHTEEEYLILPSLVERSQLTALFLFKIAIGDIVLSKENKNGR